MDLIAAAHPALRTKGQANIVSFPVDNPGLEPVSPNPFNGYATPTINERQ